MQQIELILGLLLAVAVLAILARKIRVAYPILLVLGGLVLGLVPGLPELQFDPEVIFLIFVPPLVYAAAVTTPWRDFRANLRPILFLAIGLVLTTLLAVAAVAHLAIGLGWPLAFVLAAIVAPTDTVSVTAITEHLRIPRRVVIILEGESLVNDAVALVAYRMAVAAVVIGSFSASRAGLWFLWAAAGGVIIGLAVGWVIVWLRGNLHHPPVEIIISLLTPFAAYLPAEAAGTSGVLAVVATGLYVGRCGLDVLSARTRIHGFAFWQVLVFLLNGLVFILIGLRLRAIVDELAGLSWTTLLSYAALLTGVVIVVRLVWVFPATYLPRVLSPGLRQRDPSPRWRQVVVVAWAGMRGIDSLVTAMALPFVTSAGSPFPERSLIVFLSFGVILATLVPQGLSLPALIRRLKLRAGEVEEREEAQARLAAAKAALARLDQLAAEDGAPRDLIDYLRALYQRRLKLFQARLDQGDAKGHEEYASSARRVRKEILEAERKAVRELRDREEISDDVLREIEEDLDLEELRLEE
jgi:monovalent cation/hydrogen antiporter